MLGEPVPGFSLPSTGGNSSKLSGTRGLQAVPCLHPNHDTPGCTRGSDVRRHQAREQVRRKVRGIALAREWRGVKVPGHVQEVMNFVKAL